MTHCTKSGHFTTEELRLPPHFSQSHVTNCIANPVLNYKWGHILVQNHEQIAMLSTSFKLQMESYNIFKII